MCTRTARRIHTGVGPARGTRKGRRCHMHLAWSTHTEGMPIHRRQPPNQDGVHSPAFTVESDFPGCLRVEPVLPLLGKGSRQCVWASLALSCCVSPTELKAARTRLGATYLVASCCSSSICFLSTSLASVRATICSLSNCKDFRRREEKTK